VVKLHELDLVLQHLPIGLDDAQAPSTQQAPGQINCAGLRMWVQVEAPRPLQAPLLTPASC
jgi:hypothetical protein